jgi:hypothetical protein
VLTLAYGAQLAGLLMAIGHTMKVVGSATGRNVTNSYDGMDRWPEYTKAFDQASDAANRILRHYRKRTVAAPFDNPVAIPKSRRKELSEILVEQMVDAIDHPSDAVFDPTLARKINAMLGPLAGGSEP